MLYREAGQFKSSYAADMAIFPIRQDRIALGLLLAFAFVGVPVLATFHVWPLGSDYLLRAILVPFLILSLAAIGVNILVGYCGQISLGSGAFMATTMQYRWLLVPAGIIGIVVGFALYIRERRRCDALACRMAGSRITLALLIVATLVVTAAVVLDRYPEFTSELLANVMSSDAPQTGHDMEKMR